MKLSVIIPVYNVQDTLSRCLESVLKNKVSDMEIICVDDGSTDNSLSVLRSWAKKDRRIKVFSQKNSGPANARNLGLKHAKGKYVTFIDADDKIDKTTYTQALSKIKDVDFVSWGINVININFPERYFEKLKLWYGFKLTDGKYDTSYENIKKIRWTIWNKIFKMSIIKKHHIQFPKDLYMGEDFNFFLKYFIHSTSFYHINQPLHYWYKEQQSLVGQNIVNRKNTRLDHLNSLFDLYDYFLNSHMLEKKEIFLVDIFEAGVLRDIQTAPRDIAPLLLTRISKELKELNPSFKSKIISNLIKKKYHAIPELRYPKSPLQKICAFFQKIHKQSLQQAENNEKFSDSLKQIPIFNKINMAHQKALMRVKQEKMLMPVVPYQVLSPSFLTKKAIVWEFDLKCKNFLSVSFQSFLKNSDSNEKYDVIFLARSIKQIPPFLFRQFFEQASAYPNIFVRFVDIESILKREKLFSEFPIWAFIPDLCARYKKVLYLSPTSLILKPIDALFEKNIKKCWIAGVQEEKNQEALILFNIKKINQSLFYDSLQLYTQKASRYDISLYQHLFDGKIYLLDEKWSYYSFLLKDMSRLVDHPYIITCPVLTEQSISGQYFWKYARQSPVYEELLKIVSAHKLKYSILIKLPRTMPEIEELFKMIQRQTEKSVELFYIPKNISEEEKIILKKYNCAPFSRKLNGEFTVYLEKNGYFKENNILEKFYQKAKNIKSSVYELPHGINQFSFERLNAFQEEGIKGVFSDFPPFKMESYIFKTSFLMENCLMDCLIQSRIIDILSISKRWYRLNCPFYVYFEQPIQWDKGIVIEKLNHFLSLLTQATKNNLSFFKMKLKKDFEQALELRYLAAQFLTKKELNSFIIQLKSVWYQIDMALFQFKEMPKVSVITPCYNGEKYLPSYLDSVLSQTYPNIQLIFIDDGSTDKTKAIFKRYLKAFQKRNIEVIYHYQENAGQAAALSAGLKIYDGEFLTWPDADDILYPSSLFQKVEFLLNHPDVDLVTHALNVIHESNPDKVVKIFKREIKKGEEDPFFMDLIDERNILFPPLAFMVKTASFKKMLPSQNLYPGQGGQNLQMLLPVAYSGKFGYISEPLGAYILHDSSHSNSFSNRFDLINIHIKTIQETLKEIPNLSEAVYQEVQQKLKERVFRQFFYVNHRYVNGIYSENSGCTGCTACANVCPVGAIEMKEDENGFLYPFIDHKKCIKCYQCVQHCPGLNPLQREIKTPNTYIAKAFDKIRKGSTSGGIFTLLARKIISQGGYVCGAAMDSDLNVRHMIVAGLNSLEFLRKSKYVQSEIRFVFKEIKKLLEADKTVLFSGTPCQIIGLKSFLKKDYPNLICVDIVCHGVPSQKLLKQYLTEQYSLTKINALEFRPTTKPWGKNACLSVNDKIENKMDLFTRAFMNNFSLRASCYQCPASQLKRQSDLTLGDFWGIDEYDASLRDFYGTSLILEHTRKGKKIIDLIQRELELFRQISFEEGCVRNPNVITSSPQNPARKYFLNQLKNRSVCNSFGQIVPLRYDAIVLNYWFAFNYGAVLTAFALQEFLKEKGLFIAFAHYISPQFRKNNPYFSNFVQKKLNLTPYCNDVKDLEKLNHLTSVFMTGSDQVFNPQIYQTHGGMIYLLSFVHKDKKKLSFAASFGDNILKTASKDGFHGNEGEREEASDFLKQFDALSFREKMGIDIVQKILPDYDTEKLTTILEPVFLVNKKIWDDLLAEEKQDFNKPYYASLFYYESNKILLSEIKKELNELVWDISINYTPIEFLKIIKNSKGVVTDSFHAYCFALIFERPCVFIPPHKNMKRVSNLIEVLKLKKTVISCQADIYKIRKLLKVKQNYSKVSKIIEKERQKATEWIYKHIKQKELKNEEN